MKSEAGLHGLLHKWPLTVPSCASLLRFGERLSATRVSPSRVERQRILRLWQAKKRNERRRLREVGVLHEVREADEGER